MTFQKDYYAKQAGELNTYIKIIPQTDIEVQDIATAVYDVVKNIDNAICNITDNKHTKELVKLAFDNFDKQCDILYRNKCYKLNELYIEIDTSAVHAALPYIHCTSKDDTTIQIKLEYENTFIKTDEVNLLITQILRKALANTCEIEFKLHNNFETKHDFLDRVNREQYWLKRL